MKDITYKKNPKVEDVRILFIEYSKIEGAEVCFISFQDELNHLEELYSYPNGTTILAYDSGKPVGCVAIKEIDEDHVEMKRLYVKLGHRNIGIASNLLNMVIQFSRENGYKILKLETLPKIMDDAIRLYRRHGFIDIENQGNIITMELAL